MHKISTALSVLAIVMVSLPVSLSAQNNKIEATGNVGIGTTTPPNRLTIESTDPIVSNTIRMEHKGISNSVLFLGTAANNYPVTLHQNANILESYTDLHISAANTGKIFFETGRTGTTAPVRMTLTGTGLGIGIVDPTQKLEVNGNGKINGTIITSYSNPNIGGTISIENPAKTTAGTASRWSIYNMSGSYGNSLQFWAYDNTGCPDGLCASRFTLTDDGNVGIGTNKPGSYKLAVEGTIGARRVKVTQAAWADFVFHPDYKLPVLSEVEKYIKENQHLPEIPSAAEVQKDGLDLGEMNKKLLQKVEELTLYLIEQQKESEAQKEMIRQLKAEVEQVKQQMH